MSGGQPSIRGYLVQTLIALLDALGGGRPWDRVQLEPADKGSEKIDLLWEHAGRRCAVQVKSSQNQIGKADAERWAGELEAHHGEAHELELVLVGPCAQGVIDLGRVGRVAIPAPVPLNLDLLQEAAAHRLARFLDAGGESSGHAVQRERLVEALLGRLFRWSAESRWLTREELAVELVSWSRQEAAKLLAFPIFEAPDPNPFFTGRNAELELLRERLATAGRGLIGQVEAISGLGGIGKTQTAIQYAHRFRDEYDAVFWVSAASQLDLLTGYAKVAARLGLAHDPADAESAVRAVRTWMEASEGRPWLLVLDNADDAQVIKVLPQYLPRGRGTGHVLVTSRARVIETLGLVSPLALETLPASDATAFLLRRTGRQASGEQEVTAAAELAGELDGLPLALEQAAAYVLVQNVSFAEYLQSYQHQKLALLEKRGPAAGAYPWTVATTWSLNFRQVRAESQAAAELLELSAFLAAKAIPFEWLRAARAELGDTLAAALSAGEPLSVYELLEPLARFSLVHVDRSDQTYDVHRMVQEATKHQLTEESRQVWAERAVCGLSATFPNVEVGTWETCERLTPHGLAASKLIDTYGLQSQSSARLLNRLGVYMHKRGQFWITESLFQQVLEIHRRTLGEQHPDFATSLNNLAILCYSTGRYREAEPLFRQALEIRRQMQGMNDPNLAASLDNLALLHDATGRYEEAKPLYQQALEIHRRTLGEQHPDFATSLNNLAIHCYSTGCYSEAEPLFRQALTIRRQFLGELHPDCAQSLNNLAELCRATGKYEEAEPLYDQALGVYRKVFGEQHPQFARSLNNLAELYHATGRYEDAERLHGRALNVCRQALGEQHPDCGRILNGLGELYLATGRCEQAEPLVRRALEIRRQALGEQHPDFATSLNNLATLHRSKDRYEAAEPLYQQALDIRRQVLGEQHPDFAGSLNNLAELYRSTGRYEEAEPLLRQALEVLLHVLGPNHPHTKNVQANYDELKKKLPK